MLIGLSQEGPAVGIGTVFPVAAAVTMIAPATTTGAATVTGLATAAEPATATGTVMAPGPEMAAGPVGALGPATMMGPAMVMGAAGAIAGGAATIAPCPMAIKKVVRVLHFLVSALNLPLNGIMNVDASTANGGLDEGLLNLSIST